MAADAMFQVAEFDGTGEINGGAGAGALLIEYRYTLASSLVRPRAHGRQPSLLRLCTSTTWAQLQICISVCRGVVIVPVHNVFSA
jgi:hypothetical protein